MENTIMCSSQKLDNCQIKMNSQDSRGWERINLSTQLEGDNIQTYDIYVCPNCIENFQHVRDIKKYQEKRLLEYEQIEKMLPALIAL